MSDNRGGNRVCVADIDLPMGQSDRVVPAVCCSFDQMTSDLAAGAEQHDP